MIHVSYTVASTYKGNLRMDQDQICHTFEVQTVPLVLKALATENINTQTTPGVCREKHDF